MRPRDDDRYIPRWHGLLLAGIILMMLVLWGIGVASLDRQLRDLQHRVGQLEQQVRR